MTDRITDVEWQARNGKRNKTKMEEQWGKQGQSINLGHLCKGPEAAGSTTKERESTANDGGGSEEDSNILQVHEREWCAKTF